MSVHFIKLRLAAVAVAAVFVGCASVASAANPLPPGVPCPPFCYGPSELATAYNYPAALDGTGQTIVIVVPYGSPSLADDLAAFSQIFGLPQADLVVANPPAGPPAPSFPWALETTLDAEYAHGLAPGARIVVAVAASEDDSDIVSAEQRVLPTYPGAVVSQSFGDFETNPTAGSFVSDLHAVFVQATALGDTLVASSGNLGATWTPLTGLDAPVAGYPASDPLVTAVGGTMPGPGGLLQNGRYGSEQVWNEPIGASGGAPSALFTAPPWQRNVGDFKTRMVPDVAFDAGLFGGSVPVFLGGRFGPGAGTSLGAPAWAALFALANQARAATGRGPLGLANDNLYRLAREKKSADDFHDIVLGNNAFASSFGYQAGSGYDLATGLGTPNAANLIADLASAPAGGKFEERPFTLPKTRDDKAPKGHKPHSVVGGSGT